MDELECIKIRLALEDLNTAFAYHLDHNEVDALVDLFTKDAILVHGERCSEGRQAIHKLFNQRLADGPRTARHMYSGLRLEIKNKDSAAGTSVCMTFAQNGMPPLTPAVPYLVADFEDSYVLCSDNKWRISKRHIHRVFLDPENKGPVGYNQ